MVIITATITSVRTSKRLTKSEKKWLFAGLLVLHTAFIWSNSMVSAQDSGALSGGIVLFLRNIFDPNGRLDPELLHYIIRKLAHFSEFFLVYFRQKDDHTKDFPLFAAVKYTIFLLFFCQYQQFPVSLTAGLANSGAGGTFTLQ